MISVSLCLSSIPFDQRVHGINAMHLGRDTGLRVDLLIQTCNFPPGIEELIRCKETPSLGIHPIADDAKALYLNKSGISRL